MAKYSITLNFFIPKELVQKLKNVKLSGKHRFDWRKTDFCHCTVKAISTCDDIPKDMELWAKESEKILSEQNSFKISINNVTEFPTAIFANVQSEELVSLHKKLFRILPSSQEQFEGKNYVPHVSIAIPSGETGILSNLKQNFGECEVKEIQLMIWDLENLNKPKIYKRYLLSS